MFNKISPPKSGTPIEASSDGALDVPADPIIPYIAGDGIGRDITKASQRVFDAAVAKAYEGERHIEWFKIYAGDEAHSSDLYPGQWLPEDTIEAIRTYRVAIKGPLTTPVGGGIRSLNVSLRQILDLYACVRPVKYFEGVPSPVRNPQNMDIVVYRENTEDVYAGIEWQSGTEDASRIIRFLKDEMGKEVDPESGIGIKPISPKASRRLIRKAIRYALDRGRKSVTMMHKGNIMKFTEGAFRSWGYDLAREEFRNETVSEREWGVLDAAAKKPDLGAAELAEHLAREGWERFTEEEVKGILDQIGESHGGERLAEKLVIKDRIADSMFQQILTRTGEYSVIATPNLNGDYVSDAAVAQVGGLGMAPGANEGDGVALFEATHGTAPKYADLDKVNPGSLILSGVMMFEHLGWNEAADLITKALGRTILDKTVTYDLARQLRREGAEGVKELKCSEYAEAIVANMES